MDTDTGTTWQHEQFLKNYNMNQYSTPNEVCFLVIIQQLPNNIELNYKMHKQASKQAYVLWIETATLHCIG